VPQFGNHEFAHAQFNGTRGPWQGDHHFTLGDSRRGAGHHRRRADVLITQHAEEFAEATDFFLEESLNRLEGGIARRDAGSAVEEDGVHIGLIEQDADRVGDEERLVLENLIGHDRVIVRGQEVFDLLAAGVGLFRASVTRRDDRAPHGAMGLAFMFGNRHRFACYRVMEKPQPSGGPTVATMIRKLDQQRHELKALRYLLEFFPQSMQDRQALPSRDDFQLSESQKIYDALLAANTKEAATQAIAALELDDMDVESFLGLGGQLYHTYPGIVKERAQEFRAGTMKVFVPGE
jgi:hypothetical protein